MSTHLYPKHPVAMIGLAVAALACSRSPLVQQKDAGDRAVAAGADGPIPRDARTRTATLPPTMLAGGQHSPSALAVDGVNLYWYDVGTPLAVGSKVCGESTDGSVWKCSRSGCDGAPDMLAGHRHNMCTADVHIATDGVDVYWADWVPTESGYGKTSLFRCSVDGCNDSPAQIDVRVEPAFAMSAGRLYWGRLNDGVYACTATDCASTQRTLWATTDGKPGVVETVIGDGDGSAYILGLSDYGIWSCPFDGCGNQPRSLMTKAPQIFGISSFELASDADNVYFVGVNFYQQNLILQCPKTGCGDNPKTYASGLAGYGRFSMVSDGQSLYWTEIDIPPSGGDFGHGSIHRCALPVCDQPITLVSGLNMPDRLVVDDTYVFWIDIDPATRDGQIWRAGK